MIKTYIVLPDIHIPHQDKRALACVEKYMVWRQREIGPIHGLIQLGDIGDWEPVSRHNKARPRLQEGKRLAKDFDEINEVLDRWQQVLPDDADIRLIEGNHEHWLDKYIDTNPEIEGLFSVKQNLRLDERSIRYHPFWSRGHRSDGICKISTTDTRTMCNVLLKLLSVIIASSEPCL